MAIRKCLICGKEYEACVNCSKYGGWRAVADTPEHYQIYSIIQDMRLGASPKELKEQFAQISKEATQSMMPEIRDVLIKGNVIDNRVATTKRGKQQLQRKLTKIIVVRNDVLIGKMGFSPLSSLFFLGGK